MQRTAFSMSRRIVPRGRTGTRATVTPQDLQRRRALPARSLPHPIVRPPQDRQAVPSGAVMGSMGALMVCLDSGVIVCPRGTQVKGFGGLSLLDLYPPGDYDIDHGKTS